MVRPAQSLPHRGSPAHSRVRWQPYHPSVQSFQPRSSPLAYLTPASSTASISPPPRTLSEPDRSRHAHIPSREPKLRDLQKSKYALSLVDQAVKSLCDIWPQQDIPVVFLTSGRPMVVPTPADHQHASMHPFSHRNTQLPSPISPTTQLSPITSPVPPYTACTQVNPQTQHCDVVPMKGFVHEVLRRSRTSGSVLQTALCYLEAIRPKVPDLVRRDKQGIPTSSPAVLDERIIQGEAGVDFDTDFNGQFPCTAATLSSNSLLATVRIDPIAYEADASFSTAVLDADKVPASQSKTNGASLPPLPSPLLCPRRTFLASLILASKFLQDRCYSNRAWAKLSGLPPREIGRCERALGEALEWRLWVGKLPAAQTASGRPLTKSKSEANVLSDKHSMAQINSEFDLSPSFRHVVSPPALRTSPLRRRATAPAGGLFSDDPHLVWLPLSEESSSISSTDFSSPAAYTSSPSTPGLSYSPTPTESSYGERTVQMSTFMDVSTPPPGQFATFAGAQNDKAPVPLNAPNVPFVHTGSQDMLYSSHVQSLETQFLMTQGVVPVNGICMFNTWANDA